MAGAAEEVANEFFFCGVDDGEGDKVFPFYGGIAGGGRDGAGKPTTESGDFDLKLLGLKFSAMKGLLDMEIEGETEFEDGESEAIPESELPPPKFSASTPKNTLGEHDPGPGGGLPFSSEDDLGEKNSSSLSSSSLLSRLESNSTK
ncbi:hypothetical protein U1Q18_012087 [Sarracenia purpurea var. burkii]